MSGIDVILKSEERLKENLSSVQLITILDRLLLSSVASLMESTRVVEDWAVELLAYLHVDGRKKISRLEFNAQSNELFTLLAGDSLNSRIEAFNRLKIDRGVTFHFLEVATAEYKSYSKILCASLDISFKRKSTHAKSRQEKYLAELERLEHHLGGSRDTLQPTLRCSAFFLTQAHEFKHMIAEKYYKLTYKDAIKSLSGTKIQADIGDVYNNYLLAVFKAIDKYDSERGVLTDYIRLWLRNAASNSMFNHQLGISHSIPPSRRRALQKSGWVLDGVREQNTSQLLDAEVMDSVSTLPQDQTEYIALIKKLKVLSKYDVDIRNVLLLSNTDYIE